MASLGEQLLAQVDCGGLNGAAVEALLAELRAGRRPSELIWVYGVGEPVIRRIERAAREAETSAEVSPLLLLAGWAAVAARLERLADRAEALRATRPPPAPREPTTAERRVLEALRASGPSSCRELQDLPGNRTGSNVRRLLRSLRAQGLVAREGISNGARYRAVAVDESAAERAPVRPPAKAPAWGIKGSAPKARERDGRPWTPREIETLKAGYALKQTPNYIAMDLRRSTAAVRSKARELGLLHGPAKTQRNCLSCGQPFASEGAGNRLCGRCRAGAEESPLDAAWDGCRHVSAVR